MSSQEPELDALIAALRSDLPDERDRARMRERLLAAGIAVSAGTAASTAASASAFAGGAAKGAGASLGAKLAAMSLAGKVGLGVAVIASASALTFVPIAQQDAEPAPAGRAAHVRAHVAAAAPKPVATPSLEAAPAPPVTAAEPVARVAEVADQVPRREAPLRTSRSVVRDGAPPRELGVGTPPAVAPPPAAPAVEAKRAESTLREETELLERALSALHDRDRPEAERWLAAHAARFPNGALRRERERAQRNLDKLPAAVSKRSRAGEGEHD